MSEQMDAAWLTERDTVEIADADGRLLTTAIVQPNDETDALLLIDVADPESLLSYLFGRGERSVLIDLNGRRAAGSVDTRWTSSGRRWWVQLDPAELQTLNLGVTEAAADVPTPAAARSSAPVPLQQAVSTELSVIS